MEAPTRLTATADTTKETNMTDRQTAWLFAAHVALILVMIAPIFFAPVMRAEPTGKMSATAYFGDEAR